MNEHRLDKVAEEGEGCRREEGRFWPVKGVCVCVCGGGGGGGGEWEEGTKQTVKTLQGDDIYIF